jgi:hypothetical protein
VFLGSQFHCKLHKNYVLPQRRVYFCCYAPPKISSGFWLRFATEPAILFHHFNLRTVFAVISHTSAFRCNYVSPLPCFGVAHDHRIATWQSAGSHFLHDFQYASIVPVRATTFGFPRCTR